jgi:hypothetical protein
LFLLADKTGLEKDLDPKKEETIKRVWLLFHHNTPVLHLFSSEVKIDCIKI